jgi:hypothetical protein
MRIFRSIRILFWVVLAIELIAALVAKALGQYYGFRVTTMVMVLFLTAGEALLLETVWILITGKATVGYAPGVVYRADTHYWAMIMVFLMGSFIGLFEGLKRLSAIIRG